MNINISKWNIRQRVLFLAFTPVLIITAILSGYYISSQLNEVSINLEKRGKSIANLLAPASEYALLTENQELLQNLANSTLTEAEVVRVSIEHNNKAVSVVARKNGISDELIFNKNRQQYISFRQSVDVVGFNIFEAPNESNQLDTQNRPKTIGYVQIVLSRQSTLEKKHQIIIVNSLIICVGLLLSMLLAYFFGKSVISPITKLTQMGLELQKQNYSEQIEIESGGELGELEKSFNSMAKSMRQSQQLKQTEIDLATQELTSTISLLEQKNVELDIARQQAESAGQTKADFLAKMSHEIRTPMNAVIGFTQLLMKTPQSSTQEEYTQTIHHSALQLLTVLDDVLNYSKLEAGQIELESVNYDIVGVLENVVCMLSPAAHEKQLELVLLVTSDIPSQLIGDPARVGQVVTNLVSNAIKFTKTGHIIVKASISDNQNNCKHLQIDVQDSGIGFDKGSKALLFSDFKQADSSINRRFGGTGLGLTIAKRFVELMRGEIDAENNAMGGSNFWIKLPFSIPTSAIPLPTSNTVVNITLIVVDAHPMSRRAIRNQLLRWNANVFAVANIKLAEELLEKSNNISLIIIGLNQSEFTHLDSSILHSIKDRFDLPVICLVGSEQAEQLNSIVTQLTPCITKPFRRSSLIRAIESQLNKPHHQVSLHEAKAKKQSSLLKNKLFLLAEDNDFNLHLATTILQQHDAKVISARDGEQAIKLSEDHQFDLILMDIHMPLVNGIDATNAIRRHSTLNKNTKIIAFTADVFSESNKMLLQTDFDDIVIKPIIEDQFMDIIGKILDLEVTTNKPPINTVATDKPQLMSDTMLARYENDLSHAIEALNNAINNNNQQDTIHFAHIIRGLTGYFNKQQYFECISHLENAAKTDFNAVHKHLSQLNKLHES